LCRINRVITEASSSESPIKTAISLSAAVKGELSSVDVSKEGKSGRDAEDADEFGVDGWVG
jgi:hypothetical protein